MTLNLTWITKFLALATWISAGLGHALLPRISGESYSDLQSLLIGLALWVGGEWADKWWKSRPPTST